MDAYIPSDGFFTPKRPSFNSHGSRTMYNTPVNHHHRRLHSNGNSMFHHGQKSYFTDRYGRTPEQAMPVYYANGYGRYHNHAPRNLYGNYGPFAQGVFTPPPTSVRGSVGKRMSNQQTLSDQRGYDKVGQEVRQEGTGSSSTPLNSSSASESSTGGGFSSEPNAEVGKRDSIFEADTCQDLEIGQQHDGEAVQTLHINSPHQSQFIQQQQPDVQFLHNYDSPDVSRRKRNFPTQIPIQAIHYNDEMNNNTWSGPKDVFEEEMIKMQPFVEQEQQRIFEDNNGYQQNHHVYMEPRIPVAPLQQQQQLTNQAYLSEQSIHQSGSYLPYQCTHPMQQVHSLQNIHNGLLQCVTSQQMYGSTPYKLIEAARMGYGQFQQDFRDDERCEPEVKEENLGSEVNNGVVPKDENLMTFELKDVRFAVDEQYFVDNRPVKNFVPDVQKEYKLFEERDILKDVYNVNDMDCYDPQEICGVKILPKTLKKWPLQVLGSDWGALKKHIINFTGGFGSCGVGSILYGRRGLSSGEHNWGEVGRYGVGALARFFVDCQGTGEYPLGYITFVGMNLDKVVRDLDNSKPITPAFSGPLAERNHCVESGWDEVIKGFEEYELPYEVDGDPWKRNEEMFEWTLRNRLKRRMLSTFSMDVLIFIFYNITADAIQLLAAKELYRRGWRFHKIFQVWITPWVPGGCDELEGWTTGMYKYFHYGKWEFCRAEFKINNSVLEGEPQDFVKALWD